jgi:FkbM family methyltransferase
MNLGGECKLERSEWRSFSSDTDTVAANLLETEWGTCRPDRLQRFLIALTQRTILQRGKMRAVMTRCIMSFGCPLDIRFRGCCYRIEGRNNLIDMGLLARPTYNGREIDFLVEAVKGGGVAVDIGSNVGLYALPLAKAAGPKGTVLAIDANPDMVRHLEYNALSSDLNNVKPLHMAVGGSDARVELRIRRDDVAIVGVEQSEAGSIRMKPLLSILKSAGIDRIDALKIDIEGHEDVALVPFLQQADDALLPHRIVIEKAGANGDYPGCVAEFDRLGYRLEGRTRNNSMYQRDKV